MNAHALSFLHRVALLEASTIYVIKDDDDDFLFETFHLKSGTHGGSVYVTDRAMAAVLQIPIIWLCR